MSAPIPIVEGVVRALPRNPEDVWQVAIRRVPGWHPDEGEASGYARLRAAVCMASSGVLEMILPDPNDGQLPEDAISRVLTVTAQKLGSLPGRVELSSDDDAAALRDVLESGGVQIEVKPVLKAMDRMMKDAFDHIARAQGSESEDEPNGDWPPLMSIEGMTLERIRAFAEAVALYGEAKPWEWARGERVMKISPDLHPDLGCCVAMGEMGDCIGLACYTDADAHAEMAGNPVGFARHGKKAAWSLWFAEICALRFDDADLWLDHDLPVYRSALPEAYPTLYNLVGNRPQPTAELLTALEAVLRAYAAGSPELQAAGEWTAEVATFDGPRRITLSDITGEASADLPDEEGWTFEEGGPLVALWQSPVVEPWELREHLSNPPRGRVSEARRKRYLAQSMAYTALHASDAEDGRARARQALELDRGCCDAMVALALYSNDDEETIDLLHKAVAAGQRAIGAKKFMKWEGDFGSEVCARPYMRAKAGLAMHLYCANMEDEANRHWQDLIRLDATDELSVRYPLLCSLLAEARLKDARELLDRFPDDDSAWWLWGGLLYWYQRGEMRRAAEALALARKGNRHVEGYLTGEVKLPTPIAGIDYTPGERDEALLAAYDLLPAWYADEDAAQWLIKQSIRDRKRSKAPRRFKSKQKKR